MMNRGNGHTPIRFDAVLERIPGATTYVHVLRFPHSVEELFGVRGTVRVKVMLNDLPIERSLLPAGDGTHYLLVNQEHRRQARIRAGDTVTVELERDEHPSEPELPEELEIALDLDEKARDAFHRQPPGRRRDIISYIASAKRPETRERRAVEMLERLAAGGHPFGGERE